MNKVSQLTLLKAPCSACGQESNNIVKHHWHELPDLELHTREICQSCNLILRTHRFYPSRFYREHKHNLHHILPSWEKQLELILTVLESIALKETMRNRKKEARQKSVDKSTIDKTISTFPESIEYRNYILDPDMCDDSDDIYYRVLVGFDSEEQAKSCLNKWLDSGDISEEFWK